MDTNQDDSDLAISRQGNAQLSIAIDFISGSLFAPYVTPDTGSFTKRAQQPLLVHFVCSRRSYMRRFLVFVSLLSKESLPSLSNTTDFEGPGCSLLSVDQNMRRVDDMVIEEEIMQDCVDPVGGDDEKPRTDYFKAYGQVLCNSKHAALFASWICMAISTTIGDMHLRVHIYITVTCLLVSNVTFVLQRDRQDEIQKGNSVVIRGSIPSITSMNEVYRSYELLRKPQLHSLQSTAR